MNVSNLSKKPYHIPVKNSQSFLLAPATVNSELPDGYDAKYIAALEKNGSIKIEVEEAKKSKRVKKTTETTTEE